MSTLTVAVRAFLPSTPPRLYHSFKFGPAEREIASPNVSAKLERISVHANGHMWLRTKVKLDTNYSLVHLIPTTLARCLGVQECVGV